MSFASDVKKELTTLMVHRDNAKAELTALIRMNGMLGFSNHHLILNIQTENPAIARRIYQLIKQFYDVNSELLACKKMKLKKNNLYIVRLTSGTERLLSCLSIFKENHLIEVVPDKLLQNDILVRSYLRGAFLAGGSVNNPDTSRYHLEIYSVYEEHNQMIAAMINKYGLNARATNRRKGFITYIKEGERIAEFLSLVGATNAMLKFEDVRIMRDMRNSVNRLVNCENANMDKVAYAASKQLENIEYIRSTVGLCQLPPKLQEVAEARLTNREVSLKELGDLISSGPISKSGINHRLRKISEFATTLRSNTTI